MKHTDLYNEYKKLDALERDELVAAIKAHGGEYVFIHVDEDGDFDIEERDDSAPIISASASWMSEYVDFYISRVEVDSNGVLSIYGWPKESISDVMEITDVAHGHLGYITDMIPETKDVTDVTKCPEELTVLVLTRDDIESVGYDPNISDADFQRVANSLAKHLDFEDFRVSLQYTCHYLELKPLNFDEDA